MRVYTTAAYAHPADAHLVEAAETVGNRIADAMTRPAAGDEPSPAVRGVPASPGRGGD